MHDIDSIARPPGGLNDPITRMRKPITLRAAKLKPTYTKFEDGMVVGRWDA